MEGKRLIHKLSLSGLLSFGPKGTDVELGPLNVLIGPNASGKSNLVTAISLLRACPDDLAVPIRQGGGLGEWLWKGEGRRGSGLLAAVVSIPRGTKGLSVWHEIQFSPGVSSTGLARERLAEGTSQASSEEESLLDWMRGNDAVVLVENVPGQNAAIPWSDHRALGRETLHPDQSLLAQLKDPVQYPKITYLGRTYREIRFFTDWRLGRQSPPRLPQPADLPGDFLLEDASNLGMVLNDIERRPRVKQGLVTNLRKLYPRLTDVKGLTTGGTVLTYFYEEGLEQPVPATRISDGTLRFLCLLTILCHPDPPPLICIEEPELGLHPDVIPAVAELLIDASQRTQLIVTTHSDTLVSGLSDVPESVLVCEHDEDGTKLRRLEKDKLEEWLEKYMLGELWRMGEIGGTVK